MKSNIYLLIQANQLKRGKIYGNNHLCKVNS